MLRSLRDGRAVRLAAVLVLLSLVPLALLTYFTTHLAGAAVTRQVDSKLQTASSVSGVRLGEEMRSLRELVTSYAQRPGLISALGDGTPSRYDDKAIGYHLGQLKSAREGIRGVFLTDLGGRLRQVVPATPSIVGKDFSYRDWYRGLRSGGQPYVSEAYQSAISGHELVIAAATYVTTDNGSQPGRPLGILAATYSLDAIDRLAESLQQAQGIELTVTDQRGTVVAGPQSRRGQLVSWRDDPTVAAALAGRSGVTVRQRGSTKILEAYAPVRGIGWTVSASVRPAVAFADVDRLRRAVYSVAGGLGLVLLAGLGLILRSESRRRRMEADLAVARDEALAASRLKSEFLANMSHEIRTPMNGVLGMLSLLLDTPLEPVQREHARTAQRSAEALLTVINDILDFSKVEAGKLVLESVSFDVRAVVEDVVELLRGQVGGRDLELVALVAPDVPAALRGDPARFRQVLMNLVGNAVKFTERGEVVVRVAVDEGPADQMTLDVAVSDTGIGISSDDRDRLFAAFEQGDASTTRLYGGTGLGLAISSRLVQLMGGTMAVESNPDGGSTFRFTMRTERAEDGPATLPAVAPERMRGLRVLVVDDNAADRGTIASMVESWSMQVTCVTGGRDALDVLKTAAGTDSPYDVAIVDLLMPEIDGIELVRQIRADPTSARVRTVLVTSSTYEGEMVRAREAGVSAFLTKPVRHSQLYDGLAIVMSGGHSAPLVTPERILESRRYGRPRVLVTEDNPVNQKIAVTMLETSGFRVDVANHGAEAVEACARSTYAAVLLDCQMPVMDGYEAARRIREQEAEGRRTPIIAMTASAMAGDRERCIAAGMDDYVSKPVARETLLGVLARWLPAGGTQEPKNAAPDGVLAPDMVEQLRRLAEAAGFDVLDQLLELFRRDTPQRVAALRGAVEAGDAGRVASVAHALKGSAANVGADAARALCSTLESSGRAGDLTDAETVVDELERELAAVGAALQRLVTTAG